MEYSEIVLIAFILIVVFAAAQMEKFFSFLKGTQSSQQKDAVAPKTVLTMNDLGVELKENEADMVPQKKEIVANVKKEDSIAKPRKTATTRKKTTSKKSPSKKTGTKTTKKSPVKKKSVELPKRTKTK